MWCWNVGSSRPEAPCPWWAPRVSPGAENGLGLSMLCEMVAGCCGGEMLSVGWGGCWCSSKFQDCKIFQMCLFNVAFAGCWRCCTMLYPWVAPLAQVCHWIYIGYTDTYIGDSSHLWDHGTRELRFGRRSMQLYAIVIAFPFPLNANGHFNCHLRNIMKYRSMIFNLVRRIKCFLAFWHVFRHLKMIVPNCPLSLSFAHFARPCTGQVPCDLDMGKAIRSGWC